MLQHSMVQKLSRSGSDSAESEPERPFPFRDRSTVQPITLFCLTRGRLSWVTQVEAESAPSQGRLAELAERGIGPEARPSQTKISYN